MIFDEEQDHQKANNTGKIELVKKQFEGLAKEADFKLCQDHSFDFNKFVNEQPQETESPLCNLFNGYFIGDRKRMLAVQKEIAEQLTEEQWEKDVRRGWIKHLRNYKKMQARFNLQEEEINLIQNMRTALFCPPSREKMIKRINEIQKKQKNL